MTCSLMPVFLLTTLFGRPPEKLFREKERRALDAAAVFGLLLTLVGYLVDKQLELGGQRGTGEKARCCM